MSANRHSVNAPNLALRLGTSDSLRPPLIAVLSILLFSGFGCRRSAPTDSSSSAGRATPALTRPAEFVGQVIKVIDGDTIRVVDRDSRSVLVQLSGTDAPELAQPDGENARAALQRRLDGRSVRVTIVDHDELDRITGEVSDDETSINVWLIRSGWAWHNHKYDRDPQKTAAEHHAREHRAGLWAADAPVAPWIWKNPPDDGRLYVQGNGTRYHRASCRTLDGRRRPISLEDAVAGYTPCRRCHPPEKHD